ncbi:hypothetical protein SRIMM317S_01776 [Streptomyces rimosus subsp. rimosus]
MLSRMGTSLRPHGKAPREPVSSNAPGAHAVGTGTALNVHSILRGTRSPHPPSPYGATPRRPDSRSKGPPPTSRCPTACAQPPRHPNPDTSPSNPDTTPSAPRCPLPAYGRPDTRTQTAPAPGQAVLPRKAHARNPPHACARICAKMDSVTDASAEPPQAPRSAEKTIRLIATDLDGTLLRDDKTVSSRTIAALAAAERAGIEVFFVTGRPARWMDVVSDHVHGHGLAICVNGAAVVDLHHGRRIVEISPLERPAALAVVHALRAAAPGTSFAVERTGGINYEPDTCPSSSTRPPSSRLRKSSSPS